MANNNNNDDGTNWEDWFGIEYENPWQGFRHLQDAALDQTTRFLIQQLQDLYHGILGPFDRPSTNQCKKVLQDLVDSASTGHDFSFEEHAFRADAILKNMQLFYNILPADPSDRIPYTLPLPDRSVYVNVLTLYSKAKHLSAKRGPLRCQAIVDDMKRYSILTGDLTIQPIAHDYNKVLLSWGTSLSPEKAFHAANLLQQLKRDGLCDRLSYNHVLRACAFSEFEHSPQAGYLAARVALKVYHDMVKNDIECIPAGYSYLFRACVHLDNERERDYEVEQAFYKCRKEGKVDDTILRRLETVASQRLWNQLLGELASSPEQIRAKDLPPEWTRNADSH
jgi:hypothetical protein